MSATRLQLLKVRAEQIKSSYFPIAGKIATDFVAITGSWDLSFTSFKSEL